MGVHEKRDAGSSASVLRRAVHLIGGSDDACEGGLLLAFGLWGIVVGLWVWLPVGGLPWGAFR